MKKSAGLLVGLAFIFTIAQTGWSHHRSLTLCGVNFGDVVDNFINKFPPTPSIYFDGMPMAVNDVMCENGEHMANVAIVATDEKDGKTYFGIFHIHFSEEGRITSNAAFVAWEDVTDQNDYYLINKWCEIIKSVYPNEKAKWNCS